MFGKAKETKEKALEPEKKVEEQESSAADASPPVEEAPLLAGASAPPLKPFSKKGSHNMAPPASPARGSYRPEAPKRFMDIPGSPAPARPASLPGVAGGGQRAIDEADRTLTVGRSIVLKGEIVACEHLVVQGEVEADLTDGRLIEVSEGGMYRGTAIVDEAVISGHFDGELTARGKLTIMPSGKVTGSIRYGRIVIEAGGEISGDMKTLTPGSEG
ncbi:MAG: polymer-forming cytoskeletal protein [Magnetovibrionaceae bacterium]